MFELIDGTCASWNVLVFAIIEVVLVAWGYGADKFLENIKEMDMNLSRAMKLYWRICWCYITPILLSFLVIVKFVQHEPLKSVDYKINGTTINYVWPDGCSAYKNTTIIMKKNTTDNTLYPIKEIEDFVEGSEPDIQSLGWLISMSSTLLIPLIGMYQVWKRTHKGKPIGMAMLRPTHNWKPAIAASPSVENITEERPKSDVLMRKASKRGSRMSFRKHLPPNAETLQ